MDLKISIKPEWKDDTVSGAWFAFEADVAAFGLTQAAPALTHPDQAWGGLCPFTPYDRFELTDDDGPVPYHIGEAPSLRPRSRLRGSIPNAR